MKLDEGFEQYKKMAEEISRLQSEVDKGKVAFAVADTTLAEKTEQARVKYLAAIGDAEQQRKIEVLEATREHGEVAIKLNSNIEALTKLQKQLRNHSEKLRRAIDLHTQGTTHSLGKPPKPEEETEKVAEATA